MERTLQLFLDKQAMHSVRVPTARVVGYKWMPAREDFPYKVDLYDEIQIEISTVDFELDRETVKLFFLRLADGSPHHAFCKESTAQLEAGLSVGTELVPQGNRLGPFEVVRTGPEFKFVLQLDDPSNGVVKWFCDPQMNVDEPPVPPPPPEGTDTTK